MREPLIGPMSGRLLGTSPTTSTEPIQVSHNLLFVHLCNIIFYLTLFDSLSDRLWAQHGNDTTLLVRNISLGCHTAGINTSNESYTITRFTVNSANWSLWLCYRLFGRHNHFILSEVLTAIRRGIGSQGVIPNLHLSFPDTRETLCKGNEV